jgi:hypothetical protein
MDVLKREVFCKRVAVTDEDRWTKCCVCGRISLSRRRKEGYLSARELARLSC